MNYKEKIEEMVGTIFSRIFSYADPYAVRDAIEKEYVNRFTSLYEQAQRDAVEGFVRSKHVNVYGDIPSLNEIEYKAELLEADKYLNQTKEDIKEKQ